jgi:hypothetical protein
LTRCFVCDSALVDTGEVMSCTYCKFLEMAERKCPSGHYICDECGNAGAAEIVEKVCIASTDKDPVQIANLCMTHPAFAFGTREPTHHLVVAPAIISAMKNQGRAGLKEDAVRMGIRCVEGIPPGSAALLFDAGTAIGAAAAIHILCGADEADPRTRSLAMKASGGTLSRLSHRGGTRCSKESVWVAIETALSVVKFDLGMAPKLRRIRCPFHGKNPDCKGSVCTFHPKHQHSGRHAAASTPQ